VTEKKTSPDVRPLVFLISSGTLTDGNFHSSSEALLKKLRNAAICGVDVIQIREKQLSISNLTDFVVEVVGAVSDTDCLVTVNERFDVAMVSGAHGVHLTASSIPGDVVRAKVPEGFVIGKSTHHTSEIETAKSFADYVFYSPIFETRSKMGVSEVKGVDDLKRAVAAGSPMSVIALGGIQTSNIRDVARTGVAGIAGISIFDSDEIQETLKVIRSEFE
jgi:thiamine-phosphate pyrophosphorylase